MSASSSPAPVIIATLASIMKQRVASFNTDIERWEDQTSNPAIRDYLIQTGICAVGAQTRHPATWNTEDLRKAPAEQTVDPFYHKLWFNISVLPYTPVSKVTATLWCLPDEAQDDMLTYVQSQSERGGLLSYSCPVTNGFDRSVFSDFQTRRTFSSAIWILPAVLEVTTRNNERLVFNPGMDYAKLRRKLSQSPRGAPPIPSNRIICPRPVAPKIA